MQKQLFPLDFIVGSSMNNFIARYGLILFMLNWTSRISNLSNTLMYMNDKCREFQNVETKDL